MLHVPTLFGEPRIRKISKLLYLVWMGPSTTGVEVESKSIVQGCNLVILSIEDTKGCNDKDGLNALPIPAQPGVVTFQSCACFVPAPIRCNAIINTDTDQLFKLIPMVFTVTKAFNKEHSSADATKHAEDFVLWAWGVKHRKVSETRFEINPDDGETTNYCKERHNTYISHSLSA
eukprot:2150911-Ditylum_brightwellii.AAC.1